MLARSERGTEEELLTVLPDRIHAHGELLWKASVSRIRVSGFHQVRFESINYYSTKRDVPKVHNVVPSDSN